jgi:hypothetical protein
MRDGYYAIIRTGGYGWECQEAFPLAFYKCLAGSRQRAFSRKRPELKTLQSTSAEAVAHAHAEAGRAHAQAAMADKEQRRLEADIAHARAHHEELRKENLELQTGGRERAGGAPATGGATGSPGAWAMRRSGQFNRRWLVSAGRRCRLSRTRATRRSAGSRPKSSLRLSKPQPGIVCDVGIHRRQFATALAKAFVDAGVGTGAISASEPDDADLLEITVGPKP